MATTRSSNRRFLVAAGVALALFFAVDAYLFANRGFLSAFGQATQEGQVLSKVDRAPLQASLADVIFFGSSYVRSGVSAEPFLERGLLPFNFAVSGGGPLTSYFALKRVADELTARRDKPLLVLEIRTDALMRTRHSAWSEYPQYSAIVRSRAEMLGEGPRLLPHFRDFGMTSQFLSSVLIPSSIYRSQVVPLLGARSSLEGYFYGMEDVSGFAPLYTIAVPSMVPDVPLQPPLPMSEIWPGKVEFLRAFLALAQAAGCPVVLYQSPSIFLGRDGQALDTLIDVLVGEFPGTRVVRASDIVLAVDDFDEGGHLNIKGSDENVRRLIAHLSLSGDADALARKVEQAFDQTAVGDVSTWLTDPSRGSGSDGVIILRPMGGTDPVVVESPPIALSPPGEWVLEVVTPDVRGRLSIGASWIDTSGQRRSWQSVTPAGAPFGASMRTFVRLAAATEVTISVSDYDLAAGQGSSGGRVEFRRLWRSR